MECLDFIFDWMKKIAYFMWFGHNGYVAHFIVGIIASGLISIFSLKFWNSKIKSFFIGLLFATMLGLSKEIIDPYIGRQRHVIDLIFTISGGVLGSFSVFSEKLLHFFFQDGMFRKPRN